MGDPSRVTSPTEGRLEDRLAHRKEIGAHTESSSSGGERERCYPPNPLAPHDLGSVDEKSAEALSERSRWEDLQSSAFLVSNDQFLEIVCGVPEKS